ncbi:hypothetical protein WA026_010353 [Henosepilachna vigintioctopunctata]|uniref:Uncharacterized protein n=1 Tax=Henosepilachna vigintioctopunctata TaxID=420089 RepID=A0AAW1VDU4_9CUCU
MFKIDAVIVAVILGFSSTEWSQRGIPARTILSRVCEITADILGGIQPIVTTFQFDK